MAEKNWSGNVTYSASHVERPEKLVHAQELIASAERVRMVGTRHSFTHIADGDVMLDATALPEYLELSADRSTVRVNAGMTYGRLAELLSPMGLTVSNFASLPHISIAGAVATGTHGSGLANPNLSAAVKAVQLITATGELVEFKAGDDDFDGAVVSLGALGLVVDVTLELVPVFDVAQTIYDEVSIPEIAKDIDALMRSAYSISAFTPWPGSDGIDENNQVWVKRRVGDEPSEAGEAFLSGLSEAGEARHPIRSLDASACTTQLGEPGPPVDRLPHFRLDFTPSHGDEIQSEFFVPWANATEAILAMHALGPNIADALMIGEIRAVAADTQWMSPHYGRDSLAFHFTWHNDQALAEDAARRVVDALMPFGVRPHWGKVFDHRQWNGPILPRTVDFLALVDRSDPSGKFANDWFQRVLRSYLPGHPAGGST